MKTNTLKNTSLSLAEEAFFLCCQICALKRILREYNMPHAVVCPICHVSHGVAFINYKSNDILQQQDEEGKAELHTIFLLCGGKMKDANGKKERTFLRKVQEKLMLSPPAISTQFNPKQVSNSLSSTRDSEISSVGTGKHGQRIKRIHTFSFHARITLRRQQQMMKKWAVDDNEKGRPLAFPAGEEEPMERQKKGYMGQESLTHSDHFSLELDNPIWPYPLVFHIRNPL
ncbi:hypothetical protein ACJX0J_003235 (mitochondrion) [Zea mays]